MASGWVKLYSVLNLNSPFLKVLSDFTLAILLKVKIQIITHFEKKIAFLRVAK